MHGCKSRKICSLLLPVLQEMAIMERRKMFHRQASLTWNWRQKPEGNSSKNRWKRRMLHNCCCLGNLRIVIQQVCEQVQPQCVACLCVNSDSGAMQEIPMSYKRTSFVRMPMDFLNARKLALGCTHL